MKTEDYKNLKIPEYLFITTAYIILVGILILITIELKEFPFFYYGISLGIVIIWDKVLPKNRYVNVVRYICKFIYLLYGIYGMYLYLK